MLAQKRREGKAPATITKLEWLFGLAKPALGARPISAIEAPEVLQVLRSVEARDRFETADAFALSLALLSASPSLPGARRWSDGSSARRSSRRPSVIARPSWNWPNSGNSCVQSMVMTGCRKFEAGSRPHSAQGIHGFERVRGSHVGAADSGNQSSAVHEIYADLILDATDEKYIRYISRGRFKDGITYHYQREAVQNLWKGKTVTIGRSTKPAFDVYEMGDREEATGGTALLPDHASGELLLVKKGRVLPDDYNGDLHGVSSVFNTWRGFKHKPIKHRDAARGEQVVAMLADLLGYVARDNDAQIRFILCWIADLVQRPGSKLPIAIVFMGGKGWGKTTVLNLIRLLIGDELTGTFTNNILAGKFLGDVAKNRLCVFGNELKKLTSDVEKVTLGNLIKDSFIATEGKNIRASNHANLARVAITTNSEEFNITTTDSPRGEPERALFYVRSHNNLSLGVSQSEYEARQIRYDRFSSSSTSSWRLRRTWIT